MGGGGRAAASSKPRFSAFFLKQCGQTTVNRSEVIIRIGLNIVEKCGLYLDIFSCVKMKVLRSFFAFMLEMHVRCDNQYKTAADTGAIFG